MMGTEDRFCFAFNPDYESEIGDMAGWREVKKIQGYGGWAWEVGGYGPVMLL